MVSRIIKIKKINQSYFFNLINKYQKISSGRKNYSLHYKRIIKNKCSNSGYKKKFRMEPNRGSAQKYIANLF